MCVHICKYIYIYICISVCMYIYIYIYIYIWRHINICIHIYIYIYMYSYKHAHVRTHAHTHISHVNICIHTHTHNICLTKTALSYLSALPPTRLSITNLSRNFENVTLFASATELSISGFWGRFFGCWTASKRGALVHKNSLASCQGCRHSIELRALTCPFKQSNRSAWSLLIWHPTHIYLWGRLCFIQVVRSPPSLFYYKDIKQKIVYTLLLEESGVSKKWLILMYKRQDSNATLTPAGKSGPSAQDRYCARGLGEGANKRRGNKEVKRQV